MIHKRVVLAGLSASIVMGMITMVIEAVAGAGFWSPVVFIAAAVLRDLQQVPTPVPLLLGPVALGLMAHMMNSVILGGVFASVTGTRLRGSGAGAMAGAVYGLVVFAVMWFVVAPVLDPAMLRLNGVGFAFAHLMWGGALGLALTWETTTAVAQPHPAPARS